MSPFTIGKEISHPLIPRSRVKTKVESSFSQVLVSSSAQGSSGSFDFIPQFPLGSSGHTCSKQKIIGESIERERQGLFPSSLFYFAVIHYCYCAFPFLFQLMNGCCFFFFFCNPNVSQTPRDARASHLTMMWYGPLLFVPFSVCFHSFLMLCTYAFGDVLPHAFLFSFCKWRYLLL